MKLDGHIHINTMDDGREPFLTNLRQSGIDGGSVISLMPGGAPWENRLQQVLELCRDDEYLFPFLWLDPTSREVGKQIESAVSMGVAGFKIICSTFYPGDERCIEACKSIASLGKPVMFHSGILWDGINASGKYNRPVEFEPLLSVSGLRFSLAHISWPWCDECIAVYGKFLNENVGGYDRPKNSAEMFIDNTPGTPFNYRRDALSKLIGTGYDVATRHFFGTDNLVGNYNVEWAQKWVSTDCAIYEELSLTKEHVDNIFANNLLRFIKGE